MALQITKIEDKADGFTVEFEVITRFRQTFAARPPAADQMVYAREQVAAITETTVEKPEGVEVVKATVQAVARGDRVIDLSAAPAPILPAPEEPPPSGAPIT